MKPSLASLFRSLPETELPSGLEGRIFERITLLRLREARFAMMFSYARLLVSGVLSAVSVFFVGSTILESDFIHVVSLFLSDMTLLAQYGNSIFWFLLETFPVVPVVFLLMPIFLLSISVSLHVASLNKYRFSSVSLVTS